ncbi:hypothetical protein DDB_G0291388 [Dictyostelium discoideum AX4]|nr:hypothetical protein DDB_G0291388 [Dictyostelium discoideum AX4]EAL61678.1 hypothetical protein DDB_G0291388 [Dictyostelium discoideum AX4]|eukprot:XP_635180.1 hypothetical protein DDB_G0291388 [Dictyostelium discoideum AX4]
MLWNKTILGMKSINTGNRKADTACAKLSKLVQLTNILINKEGIPFKLVGDTKRIVFRELDGDTTANK